MLFLGFQARSLDSLSFRPSHVRVKRQTLNVPTISSPLIIVVSYATPWSTNGMMVSVRNPKPYTLPNVIFLKGGPSDD